MGWALSRRSPQSTRKSSSLIRHRVTHSTCVASTRLVSDHRRRCVAIDCGVYSLIGIFCFRLNFFRCMCYSGRRDDCGRRPEHIFELWSDSHSPAANSFAEVQIAERCLRFRSAALAYQGLVLRYKEYGNHCGGICCICTVTDALVSLHWLRVPERIQFKIAVLTEFSMVTHHGNCGRSPILLLSLVDGHCVLPEPLCLQLDFPPSVAELFWLPPFKSGTLYRNTSSQLPRCSPSGVTWNRFYYNNLSVYSTCVDFGHLGHSTNHWLIDWSIDWLIDWSIDRSIDWSIDWLTDWSIEWLMQLGVTLYFRRDETWQWLSQPASGEAKASKGQIPL